MLGSEPNTSILQLSFLKTNQVCTLLAWLRMAAAPASFTGLSVVESVLATTFSGTETGSGTSTSRSNDAN
jgi:hypothetical protein